MKSMHLELKDGYPPDLLRLGAKLMSLLAELAAYPKGLELIKSICQLFFEKADLPPTTNTHYRRQLIANAMSVVRIRGIVNPPYFKTMSNDLIRAFIAQYSPKDESTV